MRQEDAFLDRLREDPLDGLTRSVYADWLEERGDPRGEYLRQEIALASLLPSDPRFPALAQWVRSRGEMNAPAWVADACPRWDVELRAYEPGRKISSIKVIRELTGMGLHDAKELSESLPARVLGGVAFHAAWHAAARLREAAGKVMTPVWIEASKERKGDAWPGSHFPVWPHAVQIGPVPEDRRDDAALLLHELLGVGMPEASRRISLAWPCGLSRFRTKEEAEAFAAHFASLAQVRVLCQPREAAAGDHLPCDFWQ